MSNSTCRYFTLVELLVVIAIISILASLLFPTLSAAITSAISTNCNNNLRQCAVVLQFYADEYAGVLPRGCDTTSYIENWQRYLIKKEMLDEKSDIYRCPAVRNKNKNTFEVYGLRDRGFYSTKSETRPFTRVFVLTDSSKGGDINNQCPYVMPRPSWADECRLIFRHDGQVNQVFLDGHSEALNFGNFRQYEDFKYYWPGTL